jgi:bifunctional enzyme CysN/CysC
MGTVDGHDPMGTTPVGTAAGGPQPITADTTWHASSIGRADRWGATGGEGLTVWFTGLSGSGKSSLAVEVERELVVSRRPAYLLDGDNLRQGLNGDLGFSADDRAENVRRVAQVARLFADSGMVALVPLVSPYRAGRDLARRLHLDAGLRFVEVFCDTPLDECERRDPKGLYARARSGRITGMTGIDDPYEPPEHPEFRFTPDDGAPSELAVRLLEDLGLSG